MSAYVLFDVTVTDPGKMAVYREWSTKAQQEHGAEVLVRGGAIEVLEGDWSPQRLVVLRFASREQAKAFYDGATYAHARTLRAEAGTMNIVLVDRGLIATLAPQADMNTQRAAPTHRVPRAATIFKPPGDSA